MQFIEVYRNIEECLSLIIISIYRPKMALQLNKEHYWGVFEGKNMVNLFHAERLICIIRIG